LVNFILIKVSVALKEKGRFL